MNDKQAAVAVGGVAFVVWWFWPRQGAAAAAPADRPLTPSVTTSETFDYSGIANGSYTPQIQRMAQAIARAEGFQVAGSVAQRANNPGNLKLPNSTPMPGLRPLEQGITKFDSADAGWAALHRQLHLIVRGQSKVYNLDMTIAQMANKWAHASASWANNVATYLGVSSSTPLWQVLA